MILASYPANQSDSTVYMVVRLLSINMYNLITKTIYISNTRTVLMYVIDQY